MLRTGIVRSSRSLEHGLRPAVRRQWQPQRIRQQPLRRTYADQNPVAGVPTGPITAGAETKAGPTATSQTGATTTPPPPPPKKPRRRFRRFLVSLVVLSILGYAGGVYNSLVNDNFHDFFTQYIPFGEDAVAYFEEREFRKRFPASGRDGSALSPQPRGEGKVTIGRSSGLSPKVAEEKNKGADLGQRGRHASALEDNKSPPQHDSKPAQEDEKKEEQSKSDDDSKKQSEAKAQSQKTEKKPEAKGEGKDEAKGAAAAPKETKPEPKPAATPTAAAPPAPPVKQIDHLNVPEATEPVVQDLVNLVNKIITAVNAAADSSKFASTLATAKDEVNKVIGNVTTLKERAQHDADMQIRNANAEFDSAAKELVRRLENEMKDQEVKWRDEYEAEREKLSESYQHKLASELDLARKVAEAQNQNALLEQEIALQKRFMEHVREQVETEREGRLGKLDDLSSGVSDLEKLTAEATNVLSSTLQTQHLQVALEAVRARIQASELPAPFVTELVALKEVSKDSDLVTAAIASINPQAYQRGIPSVAHLIDRFRRVAAEVRKASLLPEDAGVASHAASAVLSRLMFQKKSERGLPEGEDVEATLARTEVLLEEGELDAAAREMNGLKGWAGVLSRDWVSECRRVLEVRQAVEVIATEARLQSLLVD